MPYTGAMSARLPEDRAGLPQADPANGDRAAIWINRIGAIVFVVVIGGILMLLLILGVFSAIG